MIVKFSHTGSYVNLDRCLLWMFKFSNPPEFRFICPGETGYSHDALGEKYDDGHFEEFKEEREARFNEAVERFEGYLLNKQRYLEFPEL